MRKPGQPAGKVLRNLSEDIGNGANSSGPRTNGYACSGTNVNCSDYIYLLTCSLLIPDLRRGPTMFDTCLNAAPPSNGEDDWLVELLTSHRNVSLLHWILLASHMLPSYFLDCIVLKHESKYMQYVVFFEPMISW